MLNLAKIIYLNLTVLNRISVHSYIYSETSILRTSWAVKKVFIVESVHLLEFDSKV